MKKLPVSVTYAGVFNFEIKTWPEGAELRMFVF